MCGLTSPIYDSRSEAAPFGGGSWLGKRSCHCWRRSSSCWIVRRSSRRISSRDATHARSDIKLARDLEAAGLTADAAAGRESILYTVSGSGDMSEGLAAIAESSLTPKLASWEVKDMAAGAVAAEVSRGSLDAATCSCG